MDQIMGEFIDQTFGQEILNNTELLNDKERLQIIRSCSLIVHSHRHSKDDKFIIEAEAEQHALNTALEKAGVMEGEVVSHPYYDFSIDRDCMYKYSKMAQQRYFSYAIESFLFLCFALSDEGLTFIVERPDNSNDPAKLGKLEKLLGPMIQ